MTKQRHSAIDCNTTCPKTIALQHVIFWTIHFGCCNVKITEVVLAFFLGAVIPTGDLSDFCTVIFGKFGPLGELVGAGKLNSCISDIENELFP